MSCVITSSVKKIGINRKHVERTVSHIYKKLHVKDALVGIHFVGEKRIQTLNNLYRGIDAPTDVLSFAALDGESIPGNSEVDLGDIFVCVPYIRRQARRFSVSYREECLRMIIHGILHALGYDHKNNKEAKIMFGLQESYLDEVI